MSQNKKFISVIISLFLIPNAIITFLLLKDIKLWNNAYVLDYRSQLLWVILFLTLVPLYIFIKSLYTSQYKIFWMIFSVILVIINILYFYFLYSFHGLF